MESAERAASRAIKSLVPASVGAGNSDGVDAVTVADDCSAREAEAETDALLLLCEQADSVRPTVIPSRRQTALVRGLLVIYPSKGGPGFLRVQQEPMLLRHNNGPVA